MTRLPECRRTPSLTASPSSVAASKWLAEGHRGTIKLFGCPAEEGGGGKAYMMRAGVFEGLDAMLDWHPDTRNTVGKASGLANVQVEFTFRGRSSHASGAPEDAPRWMPSKRLII